MEFWPKLRTFRMRTHFMSYGFWTSQQQTEWYSQECDKRSLLAVVLPPLGSDGYPYSSQDLSNSLNSSALRLQDECKQILGEPNPDPEDQSFVLRAWETLYRHYVHNMFQQMRGSSGNMCLFDWELCGIARNTITIWRCVHPSPSPLSSTSADLLWALSNAYTIDVMPFPMLVGTELLRYTTMIL